MTRFGWCLDAKHHKCPGRIWSNGRMAWIPCDCTCHRKGA